jgi:hypothetical protein
MALCPSTCAPALPESITGGCGITVRNGGISKIVFVKCDYEFEDISSRAEWEAAVNHTTGGQPDPIVVFSGLLLAQKPKGTFTKKRISSCAPEQLVGKENQITFQDYNSDPLNCKDIEFWNTIVNQSSSYQMGYYTCDGYFYGLVPEFSIEVDQVIEDNTTGNIFFDGTISWLDLNMLCGVAVDLNGL